MGISGSRQGGSGSSSFPTSSAHTSAGVGGYSAPGSGHDSSATAGYGGGYSRDAGGGGAEGYALQQQQQQQGGSGGEEGLVEMGAISTPFGTVALPPMVGGVARSLQPMIPEFAQRLLPAWAWGREDGASSSPRGSPRGGGYRGGGPAAAAAAPSYGGADGGGGGSSHHRQQNTYAAQAEAYFQRQAQAQHAVQQQQQQGSYAAQQQQVQARYKTPSPGAPHAAWGPSGLPDERIVSHTVAAQWGSGGLNLNEGDSDAVVMTGAGAGRIHASPIRGASPQQPRASSNAPMMTSSQRERDGSPPPPGASTTATATAFTEEQVVGSSGFSTAHHQWEQPHQPGGSPRASSEHTQRGSPRASSEHTQRDGSPAPRIRSPSPRVTPLDRKRFVMEMSGMGGEGVSEEGGAQRSEREVIIDVEAGRVVDLSGEGGCACVCACARARMACKRVTACQHGPMHHTKSLRPHACVERAHACGRRARTLSGIWICTATHFSTHTRVHTHRS